MKSTKETKECNESRQLPEEGYLHDADLNNGIEKALSIPLTSYNYRNNSEAYSGGLLEKIIHQDNLIKAAKRVKRKDGKPGIDGMKASEAVEYVKRNGDELREIVLSEVYKPLPVRRVKIPKANGKLRLLGIPTVKDRIIQQAVVQILSHGFDDTFSDNSFGFRCGRNQHGALKRCKEYMDEGNTWIIDIDLQSYFDTVNHDKLVALIYREIKDVRVITLIRKFLNAGIMENGNVAPSSAGVPQGGNLSPLLSNIMLNELDQELHRRKLKFVRYADDCLIFVKSRKAAERVMVGITEFIDQNLRLTVNRDKSKIARPWEVKYLGYGFYLNDNKVGFCIHEDSIKRFKLRLKTKMDNVKGEINPVQRSKAIINVEKFVTGWQNYFELADNLEEVMEDIEDFRQLTGETRKLL